jgi:hypothetical protein
VPLRLVSWRSLRIERPQAVPHPADGLLRVQELVLVLALAFKSVSEL